MPLRGPGCHAGSVALSSLHRALGVSVLTAGLTMAFVPAAQAVDPPDTAITSGPVDGAAVLPGAVQYAFGTQDVVDHFECSVDNAAFATCVSPVTYDLPPGGHVFRVRAVDPFMQVDPSPASRIWTVRDVPCEQAGAAYEAAQSNFFAQQQKLVKAKKQLHRAHNHGTAAQLQHAKNKVRAIKTKIKKYKDAMNAAIAQEQAVC
jgi:hypothetical protein